jgi:hypothetical protein
MLSHFAGTLQNKGRGSRQCHRPVHGRELLAAPRSPILGPVSGQVHLQTWPHFQAISLSVSFVNQRCAAPPWQRYQLRFPRHPHYPGFASVRELVEQFRLQENPLIHSSRYRRDRTTPGTRTDPGWPVPHFIDEHLSVKIDQKENSCRIP